MRKKILVYTSKEMILQYLVITIGSAIFALSVVLFLLPYKVAPGGIPGIAIIISTLTKYPPGITMLVLNIPCFVLGLCCLGKDFSAKTIYTAVAISFFTDFFNEVLQLDLHLKQTILAPVFGGVTLGVGMGLILKVGGATMGTGTLAKLIATYTNIKEGTAILAMNSIVICVAGFIFRSADLALFGFLATYAASVIVDKIVEGIDYVKAAYIISDRAIEIADVILYEMERGVTGLHGSGLYTHREKDILFVVVPRKEIHDIVKIAKKLDPQAFVIVAPVHEVLGQGFRRRV